MPKTHDVAQAEAKQCGVSQPFAPALPLGRQNLPLKPDAWQLSCSAAYNRRRTSLRFAGGTSSWQAELPLLIEKKVVGDTKGEGRTALFRFLQRRNYLFFLLSDKFFRNKTTVFIIFSDLIKFAFQIRIH